MKVKKTGGIIRPAAGLVQAAHNGYKLLANARSPGPLECYSALFSTFYSQLYDLLVIRMLLKPTIYGYGL